MSVFHDVDVYGEKLANGTIKEYIGSEAIKNALLLFLSSKKSEFLNEPELGGPLDGFVFKSMSDSDLQKFELWTLITNEFSPSLELVDIEITPDFNNRITEIVVSYIIPNSGDMGITTIFTNNEYGYKNFKYEEVELIEENLKEFFLIKKPSMPDKRLLFDNEGLFWKWGKYKLVNLTPLDPYFEEILIIANT